MAMPDISPLALQADEATLLPTEKVRIELPGVSFVVRVLTELVESSTAMVLVAPAPVAPSDAQLTEVITPSRGTVRLVMADAELVELTYNL